jgi:hypothetical protein
VDLAVGVDGAVPGRYIAAVQRGLVVVLIFAACSAAPQSQHYPFVHMETTGLTTAVLVNGERVTIAWDPASNSEALASLDALRPETFLAVATYGSALQVVGTLAPELRRTVAEPRGAASEAYRSFVLQDWYVVAPFQRFEPAGGDPLAGMVAGALAGHLVAEDFMPLADGRRVDPSLHERR